MGLNGCSHSGWKKHFADQRNIQLISSKKMRKHERALGNKYIQGKQPSDWFKTAAEHDVPGEIHVHLTLGTEDIATINRKSKKLESAKRLLLTARLSSTYLRNDYVLEEPITNFFKNEESFEKLAKRVIKTIEEEIKPEIPSIAWLKQRKETQDKQVEEALKAVLKELFGKDK